MNVRDYMVERIYNLCYDSLQAIPREEWEELNQDVNNYFEENEIQEDVKFEEIFDLKPDERDQLRRCIDEAFDTYPLLETFFDNQREMNFPPLDMIKIIRGWCNEFVQFNETREEIDSNEDEEAEDEEIDDYDYEDVEIDEEDCEISVNDYITVKYFQGLFMAIYQMFMNREI